MKKLIVIVAVSLMPIISFATPKVAWVSSIYKGVVELKVELGQHVKKGQLLFQLNLDMLKVDKKYNAKVLKFNDLLVKRAKKVFEAHSLSQDDYMECLRDFVIAKEQVKLTDTQIALSKYYAPFDGTVTKIIGYDGSGLGDNDNQIQITEGYVKVNTVNQVAVISTSWEGVLDDIKVAVGEKVKKGQLLYTLNTNDLKIQKTIDEVKVKYLTDVHAKNKELTKKTISLYDYMSSGNDLAAAIATVKKDEITIKQTSGYAPFDGTVTKFYNRYIGTGIGRGKPVMDITASK